ncbi:MAG: 2-oxoglutarate and iron-dependent oxygenase domain-containing protein [Alphaproteobacteria bacterium]|jgi:isopenicillin N synthase-like dioxygenase|nr:2-oxoglutarate and iron-dependent oxygenase domain-containing protein [Alphaproteobacteria bacterium]
MSTSTDPQTGNAIPLIDLAGLTADEPSAARDLVPDMRHALEEIGFLMIVNHGVPQALIEQTFAQAKRFHDQSMAAKHAVLMNAHNNGYMAMARYNVSTSRVSEDALPDMNESFFIKRERPPDDPLVLAGRRFAGPNEWPADLPGFREALLAYTDTVDALGRRLLPAVALALDLPADTFDAAFAESQFSFRLSHYPAVDRKPGQYGFAPHTDANFMTFLAQSGVPGLQIKMASGDWWDVPHVPGSFVVNTGDMLHRWTNGRFKSTPHRVVPPQGQARYAIPYFFGPHMDSLISCLPTCCDEDNPPRYPPITYDDYINWWYDANYSAAEQDDLLSAEKAR